MRRSFSTLIAMALLALACWHAPAFAATLTAVNVVATPSTGTVNQPVTVSAQVTGGNSLLYQIWVGDPTASNWTLLQDYSTKNSVAWTPTAAGVFPLVIRVKESTSTNLFDLQNDLFYTVSAASAVSAVSLSAAPASPQVVNTAIKLTAKPTGGISVQYEFIATSSAGVATILENYGTAATCTWTPTTAGTYALQVYAREAGATQNNNITSKMSYTITALTTPPLSAVNLTVAPASPQATNTAITLTATPTGGSAIQYLFTATPSGGTAVTLENYGTSPTCVWTPTTAGTYTLQVSARQTGTTQNTAITKQVSYTISAPTTTGTPPTAVTLAGSPATGSVNSQMTMTATATGGSNLQYQFWVGDPTASVWTLLRDYAAGNTCPWTPTQTGVFPLVVRVKAVNSTNLYDVQNDLFYTVSGASALSGVTLAASPVSPQLVNTPITLTATASGGTNLEYQFSATLNGTATVLRAYAGTPTCTWTPATAGSYTLQVLARVVGTTQNPNTTGSLSYTITAGTPLTAIAVSASPTTGTVSQPTTITALPTGGKSLLYQFWLGDPTVTTSTLLKDYSTAATCSWTPTTAGTVALYVRVKESTSTAQYDLQNQLSYTVAAAPAVTGVTLTTSPATPQPANTSITLTAKATGGTSVEYLFQTVSSTNVTAVLQNYSAAATCTWKAATAGVWTVQVYARQVGTTQNPSVTATQSYTISAAPALTGLTASPASPQIVNTKITLTAQAASGSNLQYQFTATGSSGAVTVLQNYSTTSTCAWTPTTSDSYTLTVTAEPVGGTTTSQVSIPYTIQLSSALSLYVATNGNDSWSGKLPAPNSGSTDGPFATLEGAQKAIQKLKSSGLPTGGVTVYVRAGSYYRTTTFALTSSDSGTAASPITWQAYPNETPRITGAKTVTGFTAVTDSTVLSRIPTAAQPYVMQANLPAQGISDFGTYQVRGSYYPTRTAAMEVFFADAPMTLSRWPNPGSWASITSVPGGQSGATIGYSGSEPSKWSNVQNIWLHGFWTWDWADSYVNVTSIANNVITTASPYGGSYGFSVGGRFYAENILEELDQPGEWYLNNSTGILYFWPPASLSSGQVTVSMSNLPLITMNGTSYVSLNGLTIESSRSWGVTVTGGSYNSVVNCTVRNMGNYSIDVEGGSNNNVTNCLVTGDGDGGIIINGTGLTATNNEIAHYARTVYCYQAGIHIEGSGNEISHNKIYDAPHNAVLMDGTNQMLEYNEIYQCILCTQDSGAVYTGGSGPNTVRYNFIHDLGKGQINTTQTPFAAGIYDDNGGGNLSVIGNVLANGFVGILFNGGSGNTIQNNIITGFTDDVWYDGSGGSPSGNKINTNVFVDNAPMWMNGASSSGNTITNNLVGVNPLFVSPSTNNYALQSTSPAYSQITGFSTIPFSQIGRH